MKLEEKLKSLIIEKYGSQRKFCKEIDMSPSTLATIMQRGIQNASVQSVIKICQALDISADELAQDRIIPNDYNKQRGLRILAYATELSNVLQLGREYKNAYKPYSIDGIDMTDEETELFLDGIEITTNLIRKQRVRKEIQARLDEKQ